MTGSATRTQVRLARAAPRRAEQLASVEALLHRLPDGRRAIRARHAAQNREYAERPSYTAQPRMASALAPMSSSLAPQAPMGAQVMSVRAVSTPAPTPMDGGSMLGMAQGNGN